MHRNPSCIVYRFSNDVDDIYIQYIYRKITYYVSYLYRIHTLLREIDGALDVGECLTGCSSHPLWMVLCLGFDLRIVYNIVYIRKYRSQSRV